VIRAKTPSDAGGPDVPGKPLDRKRCCAKLVPPVRCSVHMMKGVELLAVG